MFRLAHTVIEPSIDTAKDDATAAVFVHGILGSSRNWRAFARRLALLRPQWRTVLVDLRNHGESRGASPPHDLQACAEDLAEVLGDLHVRSAVLVGHSFGGKVVLEYLARRSGGLRQVWVLDSPPGAEPNDRPVAEFDRILEVVERLWKGPGSGGKRGKSAADVRLDRHGVRAAMEQAGFPRLLGDWMVTNLEPVDGGFQWRFDLPAVRAMLDSYWAADRWGVVHRPPTGVQVHLVVGGSSARWSPAQRDGLARCRPDRVHVLPAAGHWVHVDDPDGLLARMDRSLPDAGRPTAGH